LGLPSRRKASFVQKKKEASEPYLRRRQLPSLVIEEGEEKKDNRSIRPANSVKKGACSLKKK